MKKIVEINIYILALLFVIFTLLSFVNNFMKIDFFNMNFFNYLTIFIGLVVSYYLNNRNNEKRKIKELIEKIILNNQIILKSEIINNIENRKILTIHLRKLSNNIENIKKLLKELNTEEFVDVLEKNIQKLKESTDEPTPNIEQVQKTIEIFDDSLNRLTVSLYCSK